MRPRRYGDAGQAFPIYITVVGGLLFLAFAYFAVGQAAVNRNGAQTAADAAALAAAQDTRDQLAGKWVEDVLDPAKWRIIFNGTVDGLLPSCGRADQLAARNDAGVISCGPNGPMGFKVEVKTNKPVGDSVVPTTENRKSHASAIAVIEPLCTFPPPAEDAGDGVLPRLSCKGGRNWDLNPDDLTDLPGPEDLFDVHLADQ
ncbi:MULTISPECIES: pilus assembly protein TadG-related protein [unclassified Streptomyces]|uniref:pilus assembly protein TadG-related protein n=1 Tax=unclassified Streptomyces TaxID=2593676 RepID=UPI002259A613|nr:MULTISPECIES: pilus assembly protein TadG-related protein [unclassified Streptomyces]MCX5050741.1 pilus assembly protein TadG-related protein [Streptomyces sp. NBC_00474]